MNPVFVIFKKELKDLLRDKRTIIAMIVVPLILIPVILSIVGYFSFSKKNQESFQNIRVAIHSNGNGEDLLERIRRRKDIDLKEDVSPYEFKKMITDDSLDFGLILNENFDEQIKNGKTGGLKLFHKYSFRDTVRYEMFVKTIRSFENAVSDERLSALGTNRNYLNPVDIEADNVNNNQGSISKFAGALLPFFFVLFILMGAMYPAIDLFTGEKERGTIETLLVLPTSRMQILIGKMLVIVTVGILSGLFSFLGIWTFLTFNENLSFLTVFLNAKNIGLILLLMIPLAIFISGLLIPISIYAKSFKEAQSTIQPLLLFIIIPLVVGMIPSVTLSFKTALIPVLNVALASKDIVAGTIDYGLLALVYLSLLIYAGLGILLAKRWFAKEKNIFRT